MTHLTDTYHSLGCDARVDNLVQPTCTTRSPGDWDYDRMVKNVEKLGWASKGRQNFCPAHAPASPEPVATDVRPSRRNATKPEPEQSPVDTAAWTDQPS